MLTTSRIGVLVVLCTAECARATAPTAPSVSLQIARLALSAESAAGRSEQETSSTRRRELVAEAARDAAACLALDAHAGACEYAQGLALGVEARGHPLRALGLVRQMLAWLARAEAADADHAYAGAARVQAQVLSQAPGWPLGPGNLRSAAAAAQRAVERHPEYPPNWLVLAAVQVRRDDRAGARTSYQRALALAQTLPSSEDRQDWIREARAGLATTSR